MTTLFAGERDRQKFCQKHFVLSSLFLFFVVEVLAREQSGATFSSSRMKAIRQHCAAVKNDRLVVCRARCSTLKSALSLKVRVGEMPATKAFVMHHCELPSLREVEARMDATPRRESLVGTSEHWLRPLSKGPQWGGVNPRMVSCVCESVRTSLRFTVGTINRTHCFIEGLVRGPELVPVSPELRRSPREVMRTDESMSTTLPTRRRPAVVRSTA